MTLAYPTSDGRNVTVTMDASGPPKVQTQYKIACTDGDLDTSPDAAFLNEPSCVICAGPPSEKLVPIDPDKPKGPTKKVKVIYLDVNKRLRNGWLRVSNGPFTPPDAIPLGRYLGKALYVESDRDLQRFYEFALFILEATTQNATSATGQSAGKGSPVKTPSFLLGPSILLQ